MKLKNLVFAAASLLMLASCAQESFDTPVQGGNTSSTNYRSLEEGLKDADVLFQKMGNGSRSQSRKVKSVETINQSTRSASPESAFYIVNYENNEGFALLSADKRLEPVFAISEEGSMNLSDTIYNKSLAYYIRGIESYAGIIGGGPTIPEFPDSTLMLRPEDPVTVISYPLLGNEKTGSILPIFHQRAPFNKYCFTPDGKEAPTGCAPLAAGTLMAYYEWPPRYTENLNWTAMKADRNHDSWAKLFSWLGSENCMHTEYYENVSKTYSTWFIPAFRNMGYKDMYLEHFTIERANGELLSGKPLFVFGTDSDKGGHVWIIDGAYYTESALCLDPNKPKTHYYHCVWGAGGNNNGYFVFKGSFYLKGYLFENMGYVANLNKDTSIPFN